LRPGSFAAIGFAVVCILYAIALRAVVDYIAGPGIVPMAPFYPAVLFATLVGGLEAGALALLLSVAFAWWALTVPFYSWRIDSAADALSLCIFAAALALIVWGAELYRRLVARLEEEEHQREMVVAELGHRVKNKLATVYALLRLELSANPEIWEKIESRMRALSAADDFVVRADGAGVPLREMLKLTLAPYGESRLKLNLEDMPIAPKQATILALLFHELATNAAKHGALLSKHGQIAVSAKSSAQRIEIEWIESGGPEVAIPKQRGFGTTFLDRALKLYQGRVDLRFEPKGLVCKLSFTLTDPPSGPVPRATADSVTARA
jgi:two-component sensor histidine kinase